MYLNLEINLKDNTNEYEFSKKVNQMIDLDIPIKGKDDVTIEDELSWDGSNLVGMSRPWDDEHLKNLNKMDEVISFEYTLEDGNEEFDVVVGDGIELHFPCENMSRW